jgi:hypothetical protein
MEFPRSWKSLGWIGAAVAALVAIMVVLLPPRQPETVAAVVARLEQVRGDVFVLPNGAAKRIAARTGAELHSEQGLETLGSDSSAVVVFPDGTRLELGADTRATKFSDTATGVASPSGKGIELAAGQLDADVAPQPAGRPMLITTEHAELRVLGTKLSVSAIATSTLMDVEEGSVQLTNRESQQSVVVQKGESGVTARGTLERTSNDLARLPVQGTEQHPVILLEAETDTAVSEDPRVRIYGGQVTDQKGVDRVTVKQTGVEVVKKGLARTGVTFQYALNPHLPAGEYRFQVQYMCGGEPKVSAQTFVVKAGPDAERLEVRGQFKVTNPIRTGWKMQWLKGDKPLTLKAGDALLEIQNEGQAHDAKVFDAFLLSPRE